MYSCNKDIQLHQENIACFRLKVPIFVARQFMRHRSFSYLEMSRRDTKGAKVPFEFWYPQDFNENKVIGHGNNINEMNEVFMEMYSTLSSAYETQVASRFLPQTTYTEFYCMGEVEGLMNFFSLRLDSHSQQPIREVAEAMLALLVQHQPELANKVIV
jgi:thymidylate synthase (FAD)